MIAILPVMLLLVAGAFGSANAQDSPRTRAGDDGSPSASVGPIRFSLDVDSPFGLRTLVPGHGAPTDDPSEIRRRLDEDRRYLAELRETISAAVERGSTLEEAVAAAAAISLRRAERDDELHRLNVEKAYADLGGDADPAEVGFERAWKELTGR